VQGYEVEGVLGRGGMGIVYEARQLSLGRKVALKILAVTHGMDPSFKERFQREGRIQAAIDHPHIVTVFEAGEWEEALFIAMRLVRGPNLKEMIIARELEPGRTLRILTPIADALGAAHEAGLTHRDIKPQNILVGASDRAFLADFGLTKGNDDSGLTRAGEFVGTIDYIAPEQIRGQPTTGAADVYSLGAVLYECLTGMVPFPKHADAAVMYAHLSEPPPLVTEQRPEFPPALDEVICRAMAKDPSERYSSAIELMHEAEQSFGKRLRAAISPPRPLASAEAAGIRDPEPPSPNGAPPRVPEPAEAAATAAPAPAPPTVATPAARHEPARAQAPAPATLLSPAVSRGEVAPAPPTVASPAIAPLAAERTAASAPAQPDEPHRGPRIPPLAVAAAGILLLVVLAYLLAG
jgi:serine/threonine protein kinase